MTIIRSRPNTWLAPVRAIAGAAAGVGYLLALALFAIRAVDAGYGNAIPIALTSPFAVVGLVTWPLLGALVAVGRVRLVGPMVLVLHYLAGLVYYSMLPTRGGSWSLLDPSGIAFLALFVLGQTLLWWKIARASH